MFATASMLADLSPGAMRLCLVANPVATVTRLLAESGLNGALEAIAGQSPCWDEDEPAFGPFGNALHAGIHANLWPENWPNYPESGRDRWNHPYPDSLPLRL